MNTENLILSNMYIQGYLRKGCENMATMISTKKDYMIEMCVSNYTFIDNMKSNYYICIFRFKDSLGNPLFELHLNEVQVLIMLDNINEYFSCERLFDLRLVSDIKSLTPGITNSINIFHNYDTYNKETEDFMHILEIQEYNSYNETYFNRLRIEMSSEDMEALSNVIYFVFLLDVDENVEFSDTFREANLSNIDYELLDSLYFDYKRRESNNQ